MGWRTELATGVRGSTFSKGKGPKGRFNYRTPTAEGRFDMRESAQDVVDDAREGYGRAVRTGGKARGGITWPRTDRFGVTRVYRGEGSTRLGATILSADERRKLRSQKRKKKQNPKEAEAMRRAAMRARVQTLARNEEEKVKAKVRATPRGGLGLFAEPLAYGIAGAIKTKSPSGFLKGLNAWKDLYAPSKPSGPSL